jgi:hypothetical protein
MTSLGREGRNIMANTCHNTRDAKRGGETEGHTGTIYGEGIALEN